MTPSEELVFRLCRKSFLSLWSYANPSRGPGKELCDVLVVCDPDVIIFSIKEIEFDEDGNVNVSHERWRRRAVEDSMKQIHGAERWIKSNKQVLKTNGLVGLEFPAEPRVHRIAIALGGKGKQFLSEGDFGKGFVHVMDEPSLLTLMEELDTITDFVGFLLEKEDALRRGFRPMILGGDEDLLAVYLQNGKSFPESMIDATAVYIDGPLWTSFAEGGEYQRKKKADKQSYVWDRMLEYVSKEAIADTLEAGSTLSDAEVGLRIMAREDRLNRRILSKAFMNFYEQNGLRCRTVVSPSAVAYVFLKRPQDYPRETRKSELVNRCFVVRGSKQVPCETVIGIATEEYEEGRGFSFDMAYLNMPEWTEENEATAAAMRDDLSYFQDPRLTQTSEDEYPPEPG